jgi:putative nucleotidyltransferase with HDIG domain
VGQVDWARELAERRLAEPLPRRWAHTCGVAATARHLAPILGKDADLIEAAAWLHDIGYSPAIASTGFHALDGARYLRDVQRADTRLCALVAYHTGAIYEALERSLESDLTSEFSSPPQPLAEALTYCDITTGPSGDNVNVQQRLADVLSRYGSDHPVSRALRKARTTYLESVRGVESRLAP